MTPPMPPPSERLARLVADERLAMSSAPPGAAEAALARLQSRILAGDPGPAFDFAQATAAPTPSVPTPSALYGVSTKLWAGAVAVAGLATWLAMAPLRSSPDAVEAHDAPAGLEPQPVAAAVPVPPPAPEASATPEALAPTLGPPGVATPARDATADRSQTVAATDLPARKHRSRTAAPRAATPGSPDFSGELQLIRDAQKALREGRIEAASALLSKHRKQYRAGAFAEEASALWAIALCRGPQPEKGHREARRFLAAHPTSLHAGRVREACPLGR